MKLKLILEDDSTMPAYFLASMNEMWVNLGFIKKLAEKLSSTVYEAKKFNRYKVLVYNVSKIDSRYDKLEFTSDDKLIYKVVPNRYDNTLHKLIGRLIDLVHAAKVESKEELTTI